MLEGFTNILRTLNPSEVYSQKPPYGPPDEYPVLSDSELKKLQESHPDLARGRCFCGLRLMAPLNGLGYIQSRHQSLMNP